MICQTPLKDLSIISEDLLPLCGISCVKMEFCIDHSFSWDYAKDMKCSFAEFYGV